MKTAVIILCGVLAAGCASKAEKKVPSRFEDGLSAATPVVLKPGSIEDDLAIEKEWLNKHYPGFRYCAHIAPPEQTGKEEGELILDRYTKMLDGRMISVIFVVLPDGKGCQFYFDITASFIAQVKKNMANLALDPTSTAVTPPASAFDVLRRDKSASDVLRGDEDAGDRASGARGSP